MAAASAGPYASISTLYNHASTPPLSFYRPHALPAAQPTVSKHSRQAVFATKEAEQRELSVSLVPALVVVNLAASIVMFLLQLFNLSLQLGFCRLKFLYLFTQQHLQQGHTR